MIPDREMSFSDRESRYPSDVKNGNKRWSGDIYGISVKLKRHLMAHVGWLSTLGDVRACDKRAWAETAIREAILSDLVALCEERPISGGPSHGDSG